MGGGLEDVLSYEGDAAAMVCFLEGQEQGSGKWVVNGTEED